MSDKASRSATDGASPDLENNWHEILNKSLESDISLIYAHCKRVYKLGDYGGISSFKALNISANADLFEMMNIIGLSSIRINEFHKSYQIFKVLYAIQPDRYEIGGNLGLSALSIGRFDEAIEVLKRVVLLKPDYVRGLINLGEGLRKKSVLSEDKNGRDTLIKESIEYYHKAVALEPKPFAIVQLSRSYEEIGEIERALNIVSSYNSSSKNNVACLVQEMLVREKTGDIDGASKLADHLMTVDPSNKNAIKLLRRKAAPH